MTPEARADKVAFDVGRLRLSIEAAINAVNQAATQLVDLRLTDPDGLAGIDGIDAGTALDSALSSLRNARRIAKLREIELDG